MKFPKFASFFKRSQSDSALSSRLEAIVPSNPRPCSLSAVDDLVLPLDTSNPFAAELIASGHLVKTSSVDLSTSSSTGDASVKRPGSSVSCASSGHISAASHTVVVEVLTRRIQELEGKTGRASTAHVISESASESSRGTCQELRRLNNRLSSELSEVRLTLDRTMEQLSVVQTKNDRLQALFDLPILVSVFQAVLSGDNPLDALIRSVQLAISQPPTSGISGAVNPWRSLLEPVVGPRSPEDYIAQVNCTLRARRESRDWRKKAIFWKGHAREDGRHQDTVTPSSSQLSDIAENANCLARANHKEETDCSHVKSETHSILVEKTVEVYHSEHSAVMDAPIVSPTESGLASCASNVDVSQPSVMSGDTEMLSGSRTSQSSAHVSGQKTPDHPGSLSNVAQIYSNLAPLASVTFRESYSIRSMSSKKDNGLSSSSSKAVVQRMSKISVQSSTSQVASLQEPESASVSANSAVGPSLSSNLVLESVSDSNGEAVVERVSTPTRAPVASSSKTSPQRPDSSDFSSGSWEHLSAFINKSFSLFVADTSFPKPVAQKDPSAISSTSAEPRVSFVESDATRMTNADVAKPEATATSATSTPSSTPSSTPNSSPTKKSRLPVMRKTKPASQSATARFIKRLSKTISKPLLVDSTNVAIMDGRRGAQASSSKAPVGRPRAGSAIKPPAINVNKSKVVQGAAGLHVGKVSGGPLKKAGKEVVRG